jgi:hypothetical protein
MGLHDAPPKPVLTLRIGVTGHRPNKLDGDTGTFLQGQIEVMLQRMNRQLARLHLENAGMYGETAPCSRVISALAEGADRLVVSAALHQNSEIMAILPFARDLYLRDFVEPASRSEFCALLDCASTIIELDGQYEPPEMRKVGYASVGISVVQQSDLLIAIWDGGGARGHGGTAEIVEYALRNDCPVIWFPSQGKSSDYYGELMRLLLPNRSVVVGAELELCVWLTRLLAPPTDEPARRSRFVTKSNAASTATSITQYFGENQGLWPTYRFFDRFQKLLIAASHAGVATPPAPARDRKAALGANLRRTKAWPVDDFVNRISQEWNEQLAAITGSPGFRDSKLEVLVTHYAWLDQLSSYYAGLYRSAYLVNYILAAGAVMAAATFTHVGSIVELLILIVILSLTFLGTTRRWHQRWIEYRDLAEKLRTMRYLRIIASPPVTPPLPPHVTEDVPAQTGWLYNAIVRECGLPSIVCEKQYFEKVRKYLIDNEVSDQIRYHYRNSARLHVFDHRLHVFSVSAFALAFVIALLHLRLEGFALHYLSVLLPTIGAALFGIRNQGEFQRVSERSKRMEAALKAIRDDLEQSAEVMTDRQMLDSKAQIIAKTMLSETSDWQGLFRARPLELPG